MNKNIFPDPKFKAGKGKKYKIEVIQDITININNKKD